MNKILIVGATSAIATACARLWAVREVEFFLVARDREKLEIVASDLRARGAKTTEVYVLNSSDYAGQMDMLEACVANLGQLDLALVAYGTLPEQCKCEIDTQYAIEQFSINGSSVIALLNNLASVFEKQRYGTLAVIGSVAGDRGRQSNYLYGSAKSAVSTFAAGLRARLYKVGVHVSIIKPGFVLTPMTRELDLPKLLVSSPESVAIAIDKGLVRNKSVIYVPGFWRWIMMVIRYIPDIIFKRLSL